MGTRGRQFSEVMWAVPRADDTAEEPGVMRVSCVGRLSPMADRIDAQDYAVHRDATERQVCAVMWAVLCRRSMMLRVSSVASLMAALKDITARHTVN